MTPLVAANRFESDDTDDLPLHCTFGASDWRILAKHWYPVALSRDVEQGPVSAKLLDAPLVVYRAGGQIVVADDLCPHRGVPLSMGRHDGEGLRCAYHGLRFGPRGRCNHMPANPNIAIPDKLHLKTYPVVERFGLVWTCLRPNQLSILTDPFPTMPHWCEPGFQQIIGPSIDISGFAGRQIEGFLDLARFGIVHEGAFGESNNIVVPAYKPVRHTTGFEVEYRSTVGNYPIGVERPAAAGFEWLQRFNVFLPFVATLVVHFPDDGRLVIMNAASPVSAKVTRLFAPIARNFDTDMPVEAVYDFNRRVVEEDNAFVESQKPECLPLDSKFESHIPSDRSSIAYRRGLRDMGLRDMGPRDMGLGRVFVS